MTRRADYQATVNDQPGRLRESAASVQRGLGEIDPRPWRRGTLGIIGMGASTHAGHLLVTILARSGRRAVNLTASDLLDQGTLSPADAYLPADSYLIVSESGRSVETVEAARWLADAPSLGLSNSPDAPLRAVVDRQLFLSSGVDSAVYTVGYTVTVQALGLIAQWLGVQGADVDVTEIPSLTARVLSDTLAVGRECGRRLSRSVAIDVVGRGAHYAAAAETALLLREGARVPATSYDTYQYLHGPMEWLDHDGACLLFGSGREIELARFVASTGAAAILVTDADVDPSPGLTVIKLPRSGAVTAAVLEILPVQHLVGELALAKGLTIAGFRYHQDDTKLN